jgi:hypothetical protein
MPGIPGPSSHRILCGGSGDRPPGDANRHEHAVTVREHKARQAPALRLGHSASTGFSSGAYPGGDSTGGRPGLGSGRRQPARRPACGPVRRLGGRAGRGRCGGRRWSHPAMLPAWSLIMSPERANLFEDCGWSCLGGYSGAGRSPRGIDDDAAGDRVGSGSRRVPNRLGGRSPIPVFGGGRHPIGWSSKTRRPSATSTGWSRSTPSTMRMNQTPSGMPRA